MKLRVATAWKYIDADTGCDVSPPRPGELYLASGSEAESVVLRETGDGGEFVDVGSYLKMRQKYGTQK